MSKRTPDEIREDGSMDDDFAFYQTGVIYAIFQDNSFIGARRIIAETLRGYQNRIGALEAEIDALKNPPYRIVIEKDPSQRARDFPYRAVVMCGNHELPFDGDQWNTEAEARAEAQAFIDKLTAPFGAKGE